MQGKLFVDNYISKFYKKSNLNETFIDYYFIETKISAFADHSLTALTNALDANSETTRTSKGQLESIFKM